MKLECKIINLLQKINKIIFTFILNHKPYKKLLIN